MIQIMLLLAFEYIPHVTKVVFTSICFKSSDITCFKKKILLANIKLAVILKFT